MKTVIFFFLILNLQIAHASNWCDLTPEHRLFCEENNPPGESRFGRPALPTEETCISVLIREHNLCEEGTYGYLDAPIRNLNQMFLELQQANQDTKYFEIPSTFKNYPTLLLLKPLRLPPEISVRQVDQMRYRVCFKIKSA